MRKITPVLAAFVTLALAPFCSAQSQLVGDWNGTISNNEQTFHIVWHVTKAEDGTVTSTFDNVDEGVLGIKVKALTVDGSDVNITIDDVIHPNGEDVPLAGTYAGKLSADGNEVSGAWTQSKPEERPPVDLTLKRTQAAPVKASPQ
jgi:hypothetical protein